MNRFILFALAAAFAVPASDAVIVPLLSHAYNPHAVCEAIQALEHDICNNGTDAAFADKTHNKPISMLCDALFELNTTLCAGKSVKDIPVQKICPLLDFIDAEICSNGTTVQKICPLLNFIDTEICPHSTSQNKPQWLKKIDGLFYKQLYDIQKEKHQ